jgi:DMSO/TMAO reductase YedYZ molybdopterin-dependent catalytic subunit
MSEKPPLPPGQRWIKGFPTRTAERMPEPFNAETWALIVDGEVTNPLRLSYSEFRGLPTTTQVSDLHCE